MGKTDKKSATKVQFLRFPFRSFSSVSSLTSSGWFVGFCFADTFLLVGVIFFFQVASAAAVPTAKSAKKGLHVLVCVRVCVICQKLFIVFYRYFCARCFLRSCWFLVI